MRTSNPKILPAPPVDGQRPPAIHERPEFESHAHPPNMCPDGPSPVRNDAPGPSYMPPPQQPQPPSQWASGMVVNALLPTGGGSSSAYPSPADPSPQSSHSSHVRVRPASHISPMTDGSPHTAEVQPQFPAGHGHGRDPRPLPRSHSHSHDARTDAQPSRHSLDGGDRKREREPRDEEEQESSKRAMGEGWSELPFVSASAKEGRASRSMLDDPRECPPGRPR